MKAKNTALFILLFLTCHLSRSTSYIVDGYMNRMSFNPGDRARVYANASGNFEDAAFYLRNVNNMVVDTLIVDTLFPQTVSTSQSWENGYGYSVSFTYVIPADLPSGLYNWENKIYFIVKSPTKDADFTLVYPSNTDQAYNTAGGKSLYTTPASNRPYAVSFMRPLDAWSISNSVPLSTGFLEWLRPQQTYNTQMISDMDLDDYAEIENTKVLVIVGHSEYWTRQARLNFDAFVNAGKNAAILSGNTMWWQVRYNEDRTKLICYKDTSADTIQDPLLQTWKWPDSLLNYPVLNSIGVDWPHGCYPPSGATYYGYKITNPLSPILSGAGLALNSVLSCKSRECDAALYYGYDSLGRPILDTTTLGFCKMELIGYDKGAGAIVNSVPGSASFVAFQKTPTSGKIINVGMMNWCAKSIAGYTGGFGGPDGAKVRIITANILNLLLADSTIFTSPALACYSTDINEKGTEDVFSIYPNPSSGKVRIRMNGNIDQSIHVSVKNTIGEACMESSSSEELDFTLHPEGIYFISVKTERGRVTKKLIVQH